MSLKHLAFLTLLLASPQAHAATTVDPLVGARIAMLGNQTVLAAPPLPTLEDSRHGVFTMQAGYLTASINDKLSIGNGQGTSFDENISGSYKGGAAALGYTSSAEGALGFYIFGTYDELKGNLSLSLSAEGSSSGGVDLTHMDSSGLAVAGGVSARIGGHRDEPFSFGVFTGPTVSYLSSKFEVHTQQAGAAASNYKTTPSSFGGMMGVQAGLRIWKIFLNPYFIYYKDLSSGCKSYSSDNPSDQGNPNDSCRQPGKEHDIKMAMSFSGYGINVGLGHFFLTAYSNVIKDDAVSTVNLRLYQLAYSFDL